MVARTEAQAAENLIRELGIQVRYLILVTCVLHIFCIWDLRFALLLRCNRMKLFVSGFIRTFLFLASHIFMPDILQGPFSAQHSPRGIFCSRTLNLRSISAIGYDMDYTLMHYNVMVSSSFLIQK